MDLISTEDGYLQNYKIAVLRLAIRSTFNKMQDVLCSSTTA